MDHSQDATNPPFSRTAPVSAWQMQSPPPVSSNPIKPYYEGPPPSFVSASNLPLSNPPTPPRVPTSLPTSPQFFPLSPPSQGINFPVQSLNPTTSFPQQPMNPPSHPQPNDSFSSTHFTPPSNSSQPPPTTNNFSKPPKINPSQIPSPVRTQNSSVLPVTFRTNSGFPPPQATNPFIAIDEGNCNPRFMRLTTYNVSCTHDLVKKLHVPFGLILQPLAELEPGEAAIPIVDFGEKGPLRCIRCKTYINPFVKFVDGGKQYLCKFCDQVNEVPPDYFSILEADGRRRDLLSRPELCKGTVEFVASSEYFERPAQPASYLFALDVSYPSVSSGMLKMCAETLKKLLNQLGDKQNLNVGIITYDTSVQFYNLNAKLQQPQMIVMPDTNEPFLPVAPEAILVDYKESQTLIDSLLDKIPSIFQNTKVSDSAFGSAIQSGLLALQNKNGKIIAFQSCLPSFGPGKLVRRDDLKILNTDKEKTLYIPNGTFYSNLAKECAEKLVAVDLFVMSSSFIDIATIGEVAKMTGGEINYYPRFHTYKDSNKFEGDLFRNLTRETGYEALLKVRCSAGLSVSKYLGNLYETGTGEVRLSTIDADKALAVGLVHDTSLEEKDVFFQSALLYTTSTGQRLIRVHTLSAPASSNFSNIFKHTDFEATVNFISRQAINEITKTNPSVIRNKLTDQCVEILYAYRKYCATTTSSTQLILPEALKLLPIYVLALTKNDVLRTAITNLDLRTHSHIRMNSMPIAASIHFLYPRLFAIDSFPEKSCVPDERGEIQLPPLIRLSSENLNCNTAHLLENGSEIYLRLGRNVSPQFIADVFGINARFETFNPPDVFLKPLQTDLSIRIHNLINTITQQRKIYQPIIICKEGDTQDMRFSDFLVEDKAREAKSYVDYLCYIHNQIQQKLL